MDPSQPLFVIKFGSLSAAQIFDFNRGICLIHFSLLLSHQLDTMLKQLESLTIVPF
jgi:hypothetical protein